VFYILSVAHMPIQIHKSEFVRAYLFGFTVQDAPSVSGLSIAGQAGQMWTLAWEWRFYIFVPFLSVLLARRSWLPAFVGITAAFALTGTLDAGRVPAWVAFAPGIVAAVLVGRVKVGARVQAVLTVVGVAAFIAAIARNEYGLSQTALCAMGFVALFFGHRAPLSVRPLRLLGEVSYSIYMLHLLVASLFITYIHSDAVYLLYQTTEQRLPLAIACLVGLFVLSFASFALIERPFMRESGRKAAPETTAIGHA
jgi:peptidoglycan/LPS O-acetylase OafA/YrhL